MERFIRQKYEQKAFSGGNAKQMAKQNTGSTSASDQPPPLPPKPGKRFGFSLRSASSTFPQQQRMEKYTPPLSPAFSGSDGRESPPKAVNKASKVFGATVRNQDDDFDAKLAKLREMGFNDTRRNSLVLKSMDGNLDRTVESLVRLGEHSKPPSRAITPVSAGSGSMNLNGLMVEKRRALEPSNTTSSNPFDALDHPPQPPQRSFTQPLPQQVPGQAQTASYNPFLTAPNNQYQDPVTLQDSFQGLHISGAGQGQMVQPSQSPVPQQYGYNPFLSNNARQPLQQQYAPMHAPTYPQPDTQVPGQPQAFATTSNPFLRHQTSQTLTPTNSNPFLQQAALPPAVQNPWQQQQQMFQTLQTQSPAPIHQQSSDFFSSQPTTAPAPAAYNQAQNGYALVSSSNPFQQFQTPQTPDFPQSLQQQQPQAAAQLPYRHDKTSILALYNYPQLAPSRPLQPLPEDSGVSAVQQGQGAASAPAPAKRSVTMPVSSGSMNPFAASAPSAAPAAASANGMPNGARHASQESVDFVGLGSGRHSPDAFAGLSARYVR